MWLQGRRQPTSHSETVEYFLSTEAEEMQYEVARCRPMLDQPLFEYLDNQIGALPLGRDFNMLL